MSTRPTSPSTITRYVLSGFVAGPCSTAPVHTLNCEPCQGQVTVDPSTVPSPSGPCLCGHVACVAHKLPSTLNTATSPTNKTDPGGTSLMRNSFFMLHLTCARSPERCVRADR